MARVQAPKEIRERRQKSKSRKKQNVQKPNLFRSFVESIWGFIVAISVLIGLLSGGYFFFRPSIEIIPPAPIFINSNDDLFVNPFTIKAASVWFPLRDISANCKIIRVIREHGQMEMNNIYGKYERPVATLEAGEQHSVACGGNAAPSDSTASVLSAEVVLEIQYKRPWFYFGKTRTSQGFQAFIRERRAYWTPKKLSFQ